MRKVNSVDLAGLNDFFDTAQMNMKNTKPKLNMDRDDIIRMAREARIAEPYHPMVENGIAQPWSASQEALERFAALVAAHEREACAKVCDARYMGDNNREDMEARRCAAAIRARRDE